MKLLLIRHGDPDYTIDSLTPKGHMEAKPGKRQRYSIGASPMVLRQGTSVAPTFVATLVTEERSEGIASFRMMAFGDISHLYQ